MWIYLFRYHVVAGAIARRCYRVAVGASARSYYIYTGYIYRRSAEGLGARLDLDGILYLIMWYIFHRAQWPPWAILRQHRLLGSIVVHHIRWYYLNMAHCICIYRYISAIIIWHVFWLSDVWHVSWLSDIYTLLQRTPLRVCVFYGIALTLLYLALFYMPRTILYSLCHYSLYYYHYCVTHYTLFHAIMILLLLLFLRNSHMHIHPSVQC